MNTDVQDRLIELFCKILEDLNEQGLRGEIFIEEGIDCEHTGFLPKASDDMYEVLRMLKVTPKAEISLDGRKERAEALWRKYESLS